MTTNYITKWMNNNIQVDIAIIDFAKAFDKVAHKRLSEKLQYYGIDGTTRIWIDAFLSKRYNGGLFKRNPALTKMSVMEVE
jgi:hypothetical protein